MNEYSLSGSRIYEATAKIDTFKLKPSEIKDAVWWDGKSEITVNPATFDILKGLAKKYNLDMAQVRVDTSNPILNKARDTAISKRISGENPIKDVTIAEMNKAEIKDYIFTKGRE